MMVITMIFNGCGACGGLLSFIKPPHKNFFIAECNKHDVLYHIGGNSKMRKQADKNLFFSMISKSVSHFKERKVISLWWFVTLSFAYFIAVRIFGIWSWNNNKIIIKL